MEDRREGACGWGNPGLASPCLSLFPELANTHNPRIFAYGEGHVCKYSFQNPQEAAERVK